MIYECTGTGMFSPVESSRTTPCFSPQVMQRIYRTKSANMAAMVKNFFMNLMGANRIAPHDQENNSGCNDAYDNNGNDRQFLVIRHGSATLPQFETIGNPLNP